MTIALHGFLLQLLIFFFASYVEADNSRKVYLVQMKVGGHRYGSSSGHHELLGEVLDHDSTVENALIYSYKESFTGFSASLTQNERQNLKSRSEVLDVSRSRNLKLHTTRSWDLMNLTLAAKRNPESESDLVVAVIDTGIWPYSELFTSDGPPPPAWLNKCHNITCNNKIVGARSYYPKKGNQNIIEENSVIDINGHGTHIASIVAGKEIEKASYFELAKGTIRGGVPNAKIAIYKTCWRNKDKNGEVSAACPEDLVLKAIDDAIEDNVHIISYSQGFHYPRPLHEDKISWAFLRALEKGMLTSTVAGNVYRANYYSVINGAPWVMTVGASSKDRYFETMLELEGENEPIIVTNTINTFETQDSFYPLLDETSFIESTRKRELIAQNQNGSIFHTYNGGGKDVLFNDSQITLLEKAMKEEAKGAIIWSNYSDTKLSPKLQFPIASIFLNIKKGAYLREYYKKDKSKQAVKIHKTVEIKEEKEWKPTVAAMSSKGPNCDTFLANILKPDIAAPGLDIIAGWPTDVSLLPDVSVKDYRHLRFNILSGTSMACPHATGLALYVKSFRPNWSPSAIKSALMTTATDMKGPGNEFAYGSGFLNATKVLDPGLIYETKHQDYINYICKQGYNIEKLRSHVGNHKLDCSKTTNIDSNADLNYPTMTAQVKLNTKFTKIFNRTVTNVGDPTSTYKVEIKLGGSALPKIIVKPEKLSFSELGETKNFTVIVTGESKPNTRTKRSFIMSNTWLTWTEIDGSRRVRSPIVIYSIDKGSKACKVPKK